MSRRLAAALAAGLLLAPGAAMAQQNALATLLAQGEHWLRENRPELAITAFNRVLGADPANPDALAGAAAAEAAQGNRAAAEALLARLRRAVGAGDPRLAAAESRLRGAAIDREALAEARRLASAGQTAEAVARYREAFGAATPPDPLAVEFYTVLAGTEQGWAAAREALAALAARQAGDPQARLALGRILTYREPSRAEGIALLRRLAGDPRIGTAATAAWRQALLWMGTGREAIPELEAFTARNPGDAAMAQRLAEARATPSGEPSPADMARQRGFEALEANRGRDAEAAFQAAIAADGSDADALGGLGIVRLRQGRAEEARALLERAVAAAPGRAGQWRQALDGASYVTELADARAAMRAGRTEAAEAALRQAVAREVPDRADAEALLGDILLRRGEAAAAEARYRAALARRPDFGAASIGLERALRDQGRIAEADDLARRRRGPAGPAVAGPGAALRAQAARTADPQEAVALLRAALAAEPGNAWIRLDLARAVTRQGRAAEGRALMAEGLGRGGAEARFAAALFAEDDGRLAEAAALLEQVPAAQRTPDMVRLLARARASAEVALAAEAARGALGYEGRNRLLAIAARPDPSGTMAAEVVRAFGRLRDRPGADEAARVALAANRQLQPAGRLAIAAALVEAGRPEAAQSLLAAAGGGNLTAEQRRQVAALQSGIAVRAADLANEAGDQAAGFEQLRPALERDPADPAANLALARLYTGANRSAEAVRVAETVLARDPGNLEARAAVVEAAIAAGNLRRAEAVLTEGRAAAPQEPRLLLLEARLARARGDSRTAERALDAAAAQRRAQTGADRRPQVTVAGMTAAPADNPFLRRAAGPEPSPPGDPVAADIEREREALREELGTRILAAPTIRARSGSGGVDRLDEVATAAEISGVPGRLGGRLALRATGVAISSGDMQNDVDTRRRFGSNALAGPEGGRANGDTTASGLGLDLAWRRRNFAVDVGTTPLGFRRTNVVGGVELAPLLTEKLRLRVTGERRAVTDSLLSWAGQRDPLSGQVWGGVVRSGGRAQLEYATGPASFYAGGGYAEFSGSGVVDNNRIEAGAGMSYAVYRQPEEELTAGLDLVYFAYDRNLRHFTLGHGGYFSPQSYAALNLPVDWRARSGDLSWRLGATLGFANWREDAVDVFPGDPARQGQLNAAAAGDATIRPRYAGQSQSGFTGGVRGDVEYALTPQLRLGAALRYDRAADWNEARGTFYLRYRVEE
ncbi:cellulose biosynthesis protein BcsC [Siccirubricoccus phaeus]|uniref:cellulose biosynthesis protein BcsC n=1 Tax=Siccirubricoccus phaeus TaxID=2595053 RepID=UPI0011F267A0|nr:cellulose biosynthesis protein BcsC [Siccirubricoccus phaeus]